MVNAFWQPHFCPPLPFIRSGQEWEAVSDASGGGSSCSSSSSGTPMKRKYLASGERRMKTSNSTSVLELKSLTTTELTPTLLKYVAATLGASPQSATSFRDFSEPPPKRPKPSTPTRPLAAPNSAAPTDRRHSQVGQFSLFYRQAVTGGLFRAVSPSPSDLDSFEMQKATFG